MTHFSRRGFLAAGAAAISATAMPRYALANAPIQLRATSRSIDVAGKAASIFGIEGPSGQGLILDPGQRFAVQMTNALEVPTLIHWHGQIPPYDQDGVPDLPRPALAPDESRDYDFAPLTGTHWMHAHIPLQEMRNLGAPLIVRSPEDVSADRQEVVMFLQDFAFKSAEEIMEEIAQGHGGGHGAGHGGGHDMPSHAVQPGSTGDGMTGMPGMSGMGSGMDHAAMGHGGDAMAGMDHSAMPAGMEMDLNDYNWDAYLTNDRTLADPQIVRVDRGGRVRLRIINAASATTFWIDTGSLTARLIAVDGHGVQPLDGTRFGLSMAQRLDLELDLPGDGAWPILALREGARERTGLILATANAQIDKLDLLAETKAPAFDIDMAQELQLRGLSPLAPRTADRTHMVMLGGSMQPYLWTIDGKIWGDHKALAAKPGERVEMMFHNMSMMGHPMHLHGHVFQVVDINGQRVNGARRDTVYVPPNAMVTIAMDAGEVGRWMLHCHHVPHLQTGMMTEFAISA